MFTTLSNESKKATYLLLIGVAGLWGVIFYRIYEASTEQKEPVLITAQKKTAYFKMIDHSNDRITMNLNYKDPFFTIEDDFVQVSIDPTSVALKKVNRPKPINRWPDITYIGYMNNKSNGQKLAMLTINNKEAMLAERQELYGVKLIKYGFDSVQVSYLNQIKYIRLR